jgi:hypothetical protein
MTLLLFVHSAERFYYPSRRIRKAMTSQREQTLPILLKKYLTNLFPIFHSEILQYLRFSLETCNHEQNSIYYLMIAQYCSDLLAVEKQLFFQTEWNLSDAMDLLSFEKKSVSCTAWILLVSLTEGGDYIESDKNRVNGSKMTQEMVGRCWNFWGMRKVHKSEEAS